MASFDASSQLSKRSRSDSPTHQLAHSQSQNRSRSGSRSRPRSDSASSNSSGSSHPRHHKHIRFNNSNSKSRSRSRSPDKDSNLITSHELADVSLPMLTSQKTYTESSLAQNYNIEDATSKVTHTAAENIKIEKSEAEDFISLDFESEDETAYVPTSHAPSSNSANTDLKRSRDISPERGDTGRNYSSPGSSPHSRDRKHREERNTRRSRDRSHDRYRSSSQDYHDNRRKRRRSRSPSPSHYSRNQSPELPPIPWVPQGGYRHLSHSERLTDEVKDFLRYIKPTPEEHCMRRYVVRRIDQCVRSYWPSSKIIIFGSFDTQLYLPTSDIDLVCINPGRPGRPLDSTIPPKLLHEIAAKLKADGIIQKCQVISKARVPIIKFQEVLTEYNVDISFNQTSGLVSAEAIKHLVNVLPGTRELTMLIKHFLSSKGLNEVYSGGIGSYTILCMVASFLQRHPRYMAMEPLENLGVLFLEFLELYGKTFNTEAVGIFIGMEGPGSGGYYPKWNYGRYDPGRPNLLSIQDPVDTNNDIAKNSYRYGTVRMAFSGAYEMITSSLFKNSRPSSSSSSSRHLTISSNIPIIGEVLQINSELIKHRAKVYDLYNSGQMQKLFREPRRDGLNREKELAEEDRQKIKSILAMRPPFTLETLPLPSPLPPPPTGPMVKRRERFPLPPRPSPLAPPGTTNYIDKYIPVRPLPLTGIAAVEKDNSKIQYIDLQDESSDDELAKIYAKETVKRNKQSKKNQSSESDMELVEISD